MRITIKLTDTQTAALQSLVHPIQFSHELHRIIDRGMLTKPTNPGDTDFSTVYRRYLDEEINRLMTELNAPVSDAAPICQPRRRHQPAHHLQGAHCARGDHRIPGTQGRPRPGRL